MSTLTQLPFESEQFILSFQQPGMGYDACVQEYDKAPSAYAECAVTLAYRGPCYCADMVSALLHDKENSVVLDAVAGTGLVGEELHKRGFKNIHAHDGAPNMIETCKGRGIYSNFVCCFLGEGRKMPLENDSYDCVTISGGTCENHLPPSAQSEFIRVLKPGGFFVNAYRSSMPEIDYGKAWEAEAKRLEDSGKWTFYGRLMFRKYNLYSDGYVDIYKVT